MLIALDYDGTYTADRDMWDKFIMDCRLRGHEIYCVTMRFENEGEDIEHDLSGKVDRIIYTGRKAKKPFLQELGLYPSIWIDDIPEFINENAQGRN